jgi:hypothetical protein
VVEEFAVARKYSEGVDTVEDSVCFFVYLARGEEDSEEWRDVGEVPSCQVNAAINRQGKLVDSNS